MAIFAIIRQPGENSPKLSGAIAQAFPDAHYSLGDGAWLVSGPTTAKEASDRVGITPVGENGTAVVIELASYYGRANPAIWSWIKGSWEGQAVG